MQLDAAQLSERDMLIYLIAKVEAYEHAMEEIRVAFAAQGEAFKEEMAELSSKVRQLEDSAVRQTGFVAGGKFFWTLVTQAPAVLAAAGAYFAGRNL